GCWRRSDMRWPWPFRRAETRAQVVTQRDLTLVEWLDGEAHFGQRVNAVRLEWLSAATAGIDATPGTVASLPAPCFRLTDAGREEDSAHPLARVIRDGPNPHQSWPDFVQWLMAQTLRHGNGLAEQIFDAGNRFAGLRPIPWDHMAPKMLPDGRLVYD